MCFEQGKVCVALDPKDRDIIVAEWPNGVILRESQKTGKIVRTWPDGHVEHFEVGDPRHFEVPILPRKG